MPRDNPVTSQFRKCFISGIIRQALEKPYSLDSLAQDGLKEMPPGIGHALRNQVIHSTALQPLLQVTEMFRRFLSSADNNHLRTAFARCLANVFGPLHEFA